MMYSVRMHLINMWFMFVYVRMLIFWNTKSIALKFQVVLPPLDYCLHWTIFGHMGWGCGVPHVANIAYGCQNQTSFSILSYIYIYIYMLYP